MRTNADTGIPENRKHLGFVICHFSEMLILQNLISHPYCASQEHFLKGPHDSLSLLSLFYQAVDITPGKEDVDLITGFYLLIILDDIHIR